MDARLHTYHVWSDTSPQTGSGSVCVVPRVRGGVVPAETEAGSYSWSGLDDRDISRYWKDDLDRGKVRNAPLDIGGRGR